MRVFYPDLCYNKMCYKTLHCTVFNSHNQTAVAQSVTSLIPDREVVSFILPPSADSRRAEVSYKRKFECALSILVNRLV